mmetsp:Transcript_18635/g.26871  ORF Transcript_18635/g.26871 Transcript_18635/m.26871 type:complete len:123 (-) Transcript_18635:135-503(-)
MDSFVAVIPALPTKRPCAELSAMFSSAPFTVSTPTETSLRSAVLRSAVPHGASTDLCTQLLCLECVNAPTPPFSPTKRAHAATDNFILLLAFLRFYYIAILSVQLFRRFKNYSVSKKNRSPS